jgi:hypothetical protein
MVDDRTFVSRELAAPKDPGQEIRPNSNLKPDNIEIPALTSGRSSFIFRASQAGRLGPSSRNPNMVSLTCQTDRRRRIRKKTQGKTNAKVRARLGTPKFPIHPEGYSPEAADAKKA